jgi:hypothetical protein
VPHGKERERFRILLPRLPGGQQRGGARDRAVHGYRVGYICRVGRDCRVCYSYRVGRLVMYRVRPYSVTLGSLGGLVVGYICV